MISGLGASGSLCALGVGGGGRGGGGGDRSQVRACDLACCAAFEEVGVTVYGRGSGGMCRGLDFWF